MEIQNKKSANINLILIAFSAILLVILFFKGCSGDTETKPATIKIPAISGKFESVKPTHEVIRDTILIGQKLSKPNDEYLQRQINELILENKALQQFYNEASDSLKTTLFNKAIELKSFSHTFDNDTLKATASGIVRGEVQSIKLDYTIKPQTIELPSEKETIFRLLAGLEYGNNISLSNSIFKANLGVQNRKGNVIHASVDNLKNVYIGYNISLFSIKGKKK